MYVQALMMAINADFSYHRLWNKKYLMDYSVHTYRRQTF